MRNLALPLMLALIVFVGAGAQAQSFTNGGFETSQSPIGNFKVLYSGTTDSTFVTGWTVSDGVIAYTGTYWNAQEGTRSLNMNGGQSRVGVIYQDFATVPDNAYDVTFWISENPNVYDWVLYPQPVSLKVAAGAPSETTPAASEIFSYNIDDHSRAQYVAATDSYIGIDWVQEVFSFVADNATTRLTFSSAYSDRPGGGALLDNVSVSAKEAAGTPELSSASLLLLGLLPVGLAWRRRRRA